MVMQPGAAAGRFEPWRLAVGQLSQEQIVAALTVVLLLGFSLGLQGFATAANFLDLLRSISKLGILGLGMGLIIISRGIDLSEVAMMAGSWCVALTAIPRGLPRSGRPSSLLRYVLRLVSSTASWSPSSKRRRCSSRSQPPTSFMARLTGLRRPSWLMPRWTLRGWCSPGADVLLGIPMPILVFAAAALVMHAFLSRTSIGRFIYAQGDNPEAARLTGVALRPLTILEYVLVAALAWLAGLVWIGETGSMQMAIVQGTTIFDVILVVVLGGISLVGGVAAYSASSPAAPSSAPCSMPSPL